MLKMIGLFVRLVYGHLEITKWLFSLHQNDLDTRLKLIGRAMTIKDGIGYVLWPCLNVIEQLQM